MINKVVFFCNWHAGDIHSNKEYVKQFSDILNGVGIATSYATNQPKEILNLNIQYEDIQAYPFLLQNPQTAQFDSTLYLNTWVGYWNRVGHTFAQREQWVNHASLIKQFCGVEIPIHGVDYYVSEIYTDNLWTPSLPSGEKIMFCNMPPHSGQSWASLQIENIQTLAKENEQINFISCLNFDSDLPNVFFTDRLNESITSKGESDLVQCAWISEQCSMIVTNSSGPGTFAMTKKNFYNPSKTLVALVANNGHAFWNETEHVTAKTLIVSSTDDGEILEILREVIKEKFYE